MAGSRVHTVGTLFTRVQSLLRTGAMKEVEKPLWYDVYAAFPPAEEPVFERAIMPNEPAEILYKEDSLRAKFYNAYGTPDVIDMRNDRVPSVCQRFIQRYNDLEQEGEDVDADSLFGKAAALLMQDGIHLKTVEQSRQERAEEHLRARKAEKQHVAKEQTMRISMDDIFGNDNSSAEDPERDFDTDDDETMEPPEPWRT